MWHTRSVTGLTSAQAKALLQTYGPNVLPDKPPPSELSLFVSQLKSPLVYVLLGAGLITLFLNHIPDSMIIFLAVFINTILGYVQERRASQALIALKKMVTPEADVLRDGKRFKIAVAELVPGDVVILNPGAKVPADGELFTVNRLFMDEAMLTGESVPVGKKEKDPVAMGTTVLSGLGKMMVTFTGAETKMGKIALEIQEQREDTPLTKQLAAFSQRMLVLVVFLSIVTFVIGLMHGQEIITMFTTVVALMVSAIPEGLLVSLTVVLAIGMQRILKRKGLVRKLASAETLGGVTTICVDKTGTLTKGHMQVAEVIGNTKAIALQAMLTGEQDDPMIASITAWAKEHNTATVSTYPVLDSIPFSAKEKLYVSLHEWKDETRLLVNGAPDVLLEYSKLSKSEKTEIQRAIDRYTENGLRVIGFARKDLGARKRTVAHDDAKHGLEWVGMLALNDPIRPTVKEALERARRAGITVVVITGDYAKTAQYVLHKLDMSVTDAETMTGEQLANLDDNALATRVKSIKLFARTSPDQKLRIVGALKKHGEVVAMMGDGVNDAPALHKSDIGVVVNEASDVSREQADLVLLDSNFETVVRAVEEGRGIFDNIRKVILYLMSDAYAEIGLVIFSLLLNLPLPLTAVMIVWINLVSDGLPNLALIFDPKRPGIMREPPRTPREDIVNQWMAAMIGIVSMSAAGIAMAVYVLTYYQTGNLELARSMTFATLGLNTLAYVFGVRLLLTPFWHASPFSNRWLVLAVLGGSLLQVLPFATAGLRDFFGVVPLSLNQWLIAVVCSIVLFFQVELCKGVYRGYLRVRGQRY